MHAEQLNLALRFTAVQNKRGTKESQPNDHFTCYICCCFCCLLTDDDDDVCVCALYAPHTLVLLIGRLWVHMKSWESRAFLWVPRMYVW